MFIAQLFVLVALIPLWFMLRKGRYAQESPAGLWLMVAFGALAIFLTYIFAFPLEFIFPEISQIIDGSVPTEIPDTLLVSTALFAGIEELAKFLPAAAYLYWQPYFNSRSDGVLYFAIVGLTYGIIENMTYLSADGALTGIIRILFGWFFHGALTAIAGYFLARRKVLKGSWLLVIFGIVLAILLHTIYNYALFVSAWNGWFIVLAIVVSLYVNLSLFVLFYITNRQDTLELQELAVDDGNVGTDTSQPPR